jgi:excisionase family DNA binding protein
MTSQGAVVVPPRLAAWLERTAGVSNDRRILIRDSDPLAYEVLAALHIAAAYYRSGAGTEQAAGSGNSRELRTWLTTADAASRFGVTDRAIRKWIATGRLPAIKCGGQWLLNSNHIQIIQALE